MDNQNISDLTPEIKYFAVLLSILLERKYYTNIPSNSPMLDNGVWGLGVVSLGTSKIIEDNDTCDISRGFRVAVVVDFPNDCGCNDNEKGILCAFYQLIQNLPKTNEDISNLLCKLEFSDLELYSVFKSTSIKWYRLTLEFTVNQVFAPCCDTLDFSDIDFQHVIDCACPPAKDCD